MIINSLFEWKINNTPINKIRTKIQQARDVVQEQIWSINDLMIMSDSISRLYNIAIKKGLSDSMICGFPTDLAAYKPIYHAGKSLTGLIDQDEN